MNKKGQVVGQIFIYIMAVIVIGAIAIVGYSAISKILTKSCDAEKAIFKSNLEELIAKYTSFGSVNKKTLTAPCEYRTVCFIDSSMIGNKNFQCANPMIRDSVRSGAEYNIFVKSNDRTIPIGFSNAVTLNDADRPKCLCIDSRNSNFYMVFSGKGASSEISAG